MFIENKEDCIEKLKQTGNAISSLKNEILQITDYESFMLARNKFSNYFDQFNSSLKELLDSIIFINEKNKEYLETIQRYENELKGNIQNNITENNLNKLEIINSNKRIDSLTNNDRYTYTKQNEEISKKINSNNLNQIKLHYNYDLLDPNDYLGYPPFEPKRKVNISNINNNNNNIINNIDVSGNNVSNVNISNNNISLNKETLISNNSKNINENPNEKEDDEIKNNESQNLLSSISRNNNSTYIVPNDMNISLLNKINEKENIKLNENNSESENKNDKSLPKNSAEQSKNKVDRVQKIITSAYKNNEILKGLNEKFGDNFLDKITNTDIRDSFIEKVEEEIENLSK